MSSHSARRATLLCMAIFFLQPVHLGLWLSRIADTKISLGISKFELSIALLGMPAGLLPSLYFAGRIVDAVGPRRALIGALGPMLLVGTFPGLVGSTGQLFFALFLFGAVIAFTEVGLNVYAARVEKTFKVNIMNRAHGFWSLGIAVGSFIGVQLISTGLNTLGALQAAAVVLLPIVIWVAWAMPTLAAGGTQDADAPKVRAPIPRGLYAIGLVVFGATIVEGAMSDWATVYMRETISGIGDWDGYAITVFAAMVTLGRFLGDGLNSRFGTVVLARLCLSAGLAGMVVLVFADAMWAAFAGFALIGFGVSTLFPLGISAVAALSDEGEARNVSVMTFGALTGFLIGPPMIGFVAEAFSIQIGFALLIPGLAVSLLLAGHLKKR